MVLRVIAFAAVGTFLIALGKPAVAGLALRGLAVFVVAVVVARVVATAIGVLEPVRLYGRRADPRRPGEVPRQVSSVAETLRDAHRDDPMPATVQRSLRDAFQHRLWRDHRLSTASDGDREAIVARVSAEAGELLWPNDNARRAVALPCSAIPDLINEVERL